MEVSTLSKDQIDRHSSSPLHSQVYELLRGKITAGEWKPGDLLPTESQLIDQYQVSRATVRQALDALVNEGFIYRERGRGTFVAHPTVEQGLVRIVSFTEDMRQRGFTPGTQVLGAGLVAAPPDIAVTLGIATGDEMVRIERLRLADGEPMSVEESYLVHAYCPDILRLHDFSEEPLRECLERAYDIRLVGARQSIRAIAATAGLAGLLCIEATAPLLHIERVSFSQFNVPVEYLRVYHRGDRYVLYNELRG